MKNNRYIFEICAKKYEKVYRPQPFKDLKTRKTLSGEKGSFLSLLTRSREIDVRLPKFFTGRWLLCRPFRFSALETRLFFDMKCGAHIEIYIT